MKIENLRTEIRENRKRVIATVIWEDCDKPDQQIYFETDEEFAQSLSPNPHAFLTACIVPAMRNRERRIFLDAEICPELRTELMTAMGWLCHWYDGNRRLVQIEAKSRSTVPSPRIPERAGFFFSGGIDALATLRTNRLNFPLGHPWSIKDGLLVYGLEIWEPKAYEYVMRSLLRVAEDAGITLIPVYTNIRSLDDDWHFWEHEWEGAVFAAIAHAFSTRFTVVSIASTYDIPNMRPLGSHPLIDPNYGSVDLRIRHDGITLSRFEKIRLVTDWDVALQNVRVCNRSELYQPDLLNCGKCEKCVRTMLALTALGVLQKTKAFPATNVTKELLDETVKLQQTTVPLYTQLIAPLREKGHFDLADAIERMIAKYNRKTYPILKTAIKELDKRHFNGRLLKLKRSFTCKGPNLL